MFGWADMFCDLSCQPPFTRAVLTDIRLQMQDETEPIETTFELNDTLHAKARIPPTDEVFIWLGVGCATTS